MEKIRFDKRKLLLALSDSLVVVVVSIMIQLVSLWTWSGAFAIDITPFSPEAWLTSVVMTVVMLVMRTVAGIYSSIWRYADVRTYLRLVFVDAVSGAVLVLVSQVTPIGFGFAITLVSVLLSCLLSLVARFIYQALYARFKIRQDNLGATASHRINIAIVGAGNIGASLAEELVRNPQAHYRPLFFVDVDQEKVGRRMNGLPIYQENDNILDRIRDSAVQEVVIALPDLSGEDRERLYNYYRETGCKVKLFDYPVGGGKGNKRRTLREFKIEDVLFRDPINLNDRKALSFYTGKTVLVTGGGGSIGSELCRQIAAMKPKRLIIFDIYENNAYDIQQELVRHLPDLTLDVLIGSVRDEKRLEEVFATYRPEVVLHAAAHKHVPLMENSPAESIKNNVLGTYNTANLAEKYGVERFVLISTDKAVNPTNIMGASKRLCEMIVSCRRDSKTRFVAVRFGNVLGSNGSVIPLFRRQIAEGGPVTITDRRIIRYFMTIPEAASLVLEAGSIAKRGELFVLDMGKPIHVYDLACNMIRMSGLVPHEDIQIEEIGLRPGEKLYEELLVKRDDLEKTDNSLIFIEREDPLSREEVEGKLDVLRAALANPTKDTVYKAMHGTVPTFHTPEEVNRAAEQAAEMKQANT